MAFIVGASDLMSSLSAMPPYSRDVERRRVGIFGGSFDPVHIGHLVAAVNARHAAQLDQVLMMVANDPWQKQDRVVTDAETRFAAVAAAVAGHPALVASRLEIDRGGPTYTVDTLRQLTQLDPDADYFLVLGNDAAATVDTWNHAEEVARLARLIVVNRPGAEMPVLASWWRFETVEVPSLEVSSTDLRNRLIDGRPLDFLVPDAAVDVLRSSLPPQSR
jgi:nicotinate-nucleotide adenylyltransferase